MPSYLADQSLYVMQNEFGLIKIGRSINPEQRRCSLESYEKCRITMILVRPGEGHREEEFHIKLADSRIGGEWFEGTEESRIAIARAFAPDMLNWRHTYAPERADHWLDGFWDRQLDSSVPRAISRLHGRIRRAREPDWVIDDFAWSMYWLMEIGDRPAGSVDRDENGEIFVTATVDGELLRMPPFTRELEAAMTLWPPNRAPTRWDGSALECCKAALEARRAWWKSNRAIAVRLAQLRLADHIRPFGEGSG